MAQAILKHVKKPLQTKKKQNYNSGLSPSDLKQLDEIWEKLLELAKTTGQVTSRFGRFLTELDERRKSERSEQIRRRASRGGIR